MARVVSVSSSLLLLLLLLLAFCFAAAISQVHADKTPPAIFVFGDSLSDVGNNNVLPADAYHADHPHYGVDFPGGVPTGRFTNGYNFVDVIAQHMGFKQSPPPYASVANSTADMLSGVNFASGGSGILVECGNGTDRKCITMAEQINNFKRVRFLLKSALGDRASEELISQSIFIFTCGANDLNNFAGTQLIPLPFGPVDKFISNMTSTFKEQLKELYNYGGRKFAIINVPAIGMIPVARALDPLRNFGIDFQGILNYYAIKFNRAEEKMLKELSTALGDMKYSIGNAYAAIMDVIKHPTEHGIKNVTGPCCGDVQLANLLPPKINIIYCTSEVPYCSDRSEYVFWDFIHPTQPVIEYASGLFYTGSQSYAKPINWKQLVESEIIAAGAMAGGGAEAM